MSMISEELLQTIEDISNETSFNELIPLVDAHLAKYGEKSVHTQWENLADVAFLALRHNKPKAFHRTVDMIARICVTLSEHNLAGVEIFGSELGRACCLTCSDAPRDPIVVAYMLGHLKGMLQAYRDGYEPHLDASVREKTRSAVAAILSFYGIVSVSNEASPVR